MPMLKNALKWLLVLLTVAILFIASLDLAALSVEGNHNTREVNLFFFWPFVLALACVLANVALHIGGRRDLVSATILLAIGLYAYLWTLEALGIPAVVHVALLVTPNVLIALLLLWELALRGPQVAAPRLTRAQLRRLSR